MNSTVIIPQISAGSSPGKPQRTISDLDGRTRAARRARDLAAAFTADLGGTLTAAQRLSVDRAATLTYHESHTPEYRAWNMMMQRCYNPRIRVFKDYGARGIKVCEDWRAD
jgi:hypothetical protein